MGIVESQNKKFYKVQISCRLACMHTSTKISNQISVNIQFFLNKKKLETTKKLMNTP